ncbi:Hsp20/alpha crystallin family protein [Pontibacter korlensis]|uniref:Heat-shock protein Hsp20 n=1 Tax=Pontibacter korlensis TaxID=400092 RepID=A0A0E3ZCP3_9BACT|nr:Hsp20/alpha crystallin family protein [Pontibacter korlensis]AKD02725.1 heat-shock protein Hsp20 [Pontibacter korlensis]
MADLIKRRGGAPMRSVFSDFFSDVDRFFENDFLRMPSQVGRQMMSNVPATNIRENEKDFTIEVAAPGLNKEDFHIDVNEGVLTISSQREDERTDEQENFTRREYNYSSFSRSFRLPDTVKEDDIKARYENGVLHVSVPKGTEQERPRRRINID